MLTDFYAMYDVDVGYDRFMILQAMGGAESSAASPVLVLNWFEEITERLESGN